MTACRIIFLELNKTPFTQEDAKFEIASRFKKLPEVSTFIENAMNVSPKEITPGLVFYIDSQDAERIVNNAKYINGLGIGTIHSVAMSGTPHNTTCFYTTVPGTMQEVSEKWHQLNLAQESYVQCSLYPLDDYYCYIFGNKPLEKEGCSVDNLVKRTQEWKKQVNGLCEKMASLNTPHFAVTSLILL